ncbi:MAG: glycosyltransferase family 2 protein [Planctomycetota bacterium]|nr:glycosyltransferase family 2 protein [Planctomycetota bacterium]
MRVVGFTIVRNAVRYDYPVVESIRSALPLVDEFLVAVGQCDDGTRELIESIGSCKLRIIDTVWDDNQRRGGTVLAQQTNIAMDHCEGDWLVYLQADEVLHENDQDSIAKSMKRNLGRPRIQGLSFRYHHFVADYGIRDPLPYRKQVRIIRPGVGVQSWGDACGFRIDGRKLRSATTGAWVYHYGYVKPPENMTAKLDYFSSLYDGRLVTPGQEQMQEVELQPKTCEPFRGTHPAVMHDRIQNKDWITPPIRLVSRWRNPKYWHGMLDKNTRTLRRWAGMRAEDKSKAA